MHASNAKKCNVASRRTGPRAVEHNHGTQEEEAHSAGTLPDQKPEQIRSRREAPDARGWSSCLN